MYLFSVCNDATLPDNQGIHLTVHSSTSAYIWKYMIYIVWIHHNIPLANTKYKSRNSYIWGQMFQYEW